VNRIEGLMLLISKVDDKYQLTAIINIVKKKIKKIAIFLLKSWPTSIPLFTQNFLHLMLTTRNLKVPRSIYAHRIISIISFCKILILYQILMTHQNTLEINSSFTFYIDPKLFDYFNSSLTSRELILILQNLN
jgi:hypothetical protein